MPEESGRLFAGGNRNPYQFGFSIRSSGSSWPQQEQVDAVAKLLDRPSFYVDDEGYECDLFAGVIHPDRKHVAYLQSRSKQKHGLSGANYIDVTIKIHLVDHTGDRSVEIKSYNPFFGCDVHYFAWIDSWVLLIYEEKHETYACRFGDVWPPQFEAIQYRWIIHDGVIYSMGYESQTVQRLDSLSFERLSDISLDEAGAAGVLLPES